MTTRALLRALCAATILTIGAAGTAAADQGTPTPSPSASPPSEIGHVETSDRSSGTLESSARTTYVVSKQDILRNGYRSVADAVENIPGVVLNRYGPAGALATAGIRGSTSEQVLVMINGTPLGSQAGALDLNAMPTTGITRIEIVEGGGATLYGAGSIGGIINVITKPLQGPANIEVRSGSFGDRLVRVETANVAIERAVATNNYAYPAGNGIAAGTRSNDDSQLTDGRFAFDRMLGTTAASISGGISEHHLGIPGSVPPTFTTPSRQNSVDRDLHLAFTSKRGSAATTLELGGSSYQVFSYCNNAADFNCSTPLGFLTTESRIGASLRNVVTHERSKTIYGVDVARDVARIDDGGATNLFASPAPPGPLTAIITTNAYSQTAVFVQQNWIATTGSRYYVGLREERDGALGAIFAPSMGFLQHISSDITLRGNYATAFRAPNSFELYYPNYGDTRLQPERERVADLKLSDAGILGGASLTWFGSWTTNFITTDPITFLAKNVGQANTAGLIAELRTKPAHHIYDRLSVTDLYRALDLTPGSSTQGSRLPFAGPVLIVNEELGFQGETGALVQSAGIAARNHGPQAGFNGIASAYTRIDGFVRFRLMKDALLTIRSNNLGNEAIQDQFGYPQPGRGFALELSTR